MKAIQLTKADHVKLLALVEAERRSSGNQHIGPLSQELKRARLVDSASIPQDIK